MPETVQEPKRLRIKNGTESNLWDESQLPVVILAGIFALVTLVFTLNNALVHFLWIVWIGGAAFVLTCMSTNNPNMRLWQVFYTYLFTPRGTYNFVENTRLVSKKHKEKKES